MAAWEDPELNSSHEHKKSTATYIIIPSERDLKTGLTVSTTKGKRTTLSWIGERVI